MAAGEPPAIVPNAGDARTRARWHRCLDSGGREVSLEYASGFSRGRNFAQRTVWYWIPAFAGMTLVRSVVGRADYHSRLCGNDARAVGHSPCEYHSRLRGDPDLTVGSFRVLPTAQPDARTGVSLISLCRSRFPVYGFAMSATRPHVCLHVVVCGFCLLRLHGRVSMGHPLVGFTETGVGPTTRASRVRRPDLWIPDAGG